MVSVFRGESPTPSPVQSGGILLRLGRRQSDSEVSDRIAQMVAINGTEGCFHRRPLGRRKVTVEPGRGCPPSARFQPVQESHEFTMLWQLLACQCRRKALAPRDQCGKLRPANVQRHIQTAQRGTFPDNARDIR